MENNKMFNQSSNVFFKVAKFFKKESNNIKVSKRQGGLFWTTNRQNDAFGLSDDVNYFIKNRKM